MTIQSFNKLGVILAFKLNQDYIATALCENKDKPEMHCNGRCVLAKKLKQAEQNEEKQRLEIQKKANVLFFYKMSRLEFSESLIDTTRPNFNAFYLSFKTAVFINDIFKPPRNLFV